MDSDDNNWNRKEKDAFSMKKLMEMRKNNAKILERHAAVENDRIAAENNNASVTNANKRSERSKTERMIRDQPERSRAERIMRNQPDRSRDERAVREMSTYTREWDRGKHSDGDWESNNHRAFKDYKSSNWNKKQVKTDNCTKHERKNRRHDYSGEKSTKNNNYPHFPDNYYKKKESSSKPESLHEKPRRDFSYSKKYSTHDSSSSSTEADYSYNKNSKMRRPNVETSTLWRSDRLNEDKNKQERTVIWVKSQRKSSIEQENISAEEEAKSASPKRKYYEFEISSEKGLCDKYLPPKSKQTKQNVSISNKYDNTLEKNKITEPNKHGHSKHYSKFDRFDHSNESSNESDTSYQSDPLVKKEVNCNLEGENFDSEKRVESEEPLNSASKSSHDIEPPFVENFVNPRCNPIKKVSSQKVVSSFNDKSSNFSEKNLQIGYKTKYDPHYDSPSSYKNERYTKQRKCDKFECSGWKKSVNVEKCTSGAQSAFFNQHSDSVNYDDNWGNTGDDPYNEGGWGVNEDGIDESWKKEELKVPDQFSMKLKANKEKITNQHGNKKKADKYKVKDPSLSDDGGWSTVEEGEIRSDDSGDHKE